jgi:hypothetical protein
MQFLWIPKGGVLTLVRQVGTVRAAVKPTRQIGRWFKLIAALAVCAAIPCGEQVLPQLLAQIASFDPDHAVSLHVGSQGVDLVLSHDHDSLPKNYEDSVLVLSGSEPAHVVHFFTGPATAKDSSSPTIGNATQLVFHLSTAIATEYRTFVPQLPLAYSRPPPDEISISQLDRSTLLLI